MVQRELAVAIAIRRLGGFGHMRYLVRRDFKYQDQILGFFAQSAQSGPRMLYQVNFNVSNMQPQKLFKYGKVVALGGRRCQSQ